MATFALCVLGLCLRLVPKKYVGITLKDHTDIWNNYHNEAFGQVT